MNQQIPCLRCGVILTATLDDDGYYEVPLEVVMQEPGAVLTALCVDCVSDDWTLVVRFLRMNAAKALDSAERYLANLHVVDNHPQAKTDPEHQRRLAEAQAMVEEWRAQLASLAQAPDDEPPPDPEEAS